MYPDYLDSVQPNRRPRFVIRRSSVYALSLSLSLFNYQPDEYMESVVVHLEEQSLHLLLAAIADECQLESNIGIKRAPHPLSPRSSP